MALLCGALFAISAERSDGTDLRGGEYTDLASVVVAERDRTQALTDEVARLTAEIESLSAGIGDRSVDRVQREEEVLEDPAGLTPRTGEAIQVTLTDAPPEVQADKSRDPLEIVVHQQDIQAVANAMWQAGAVAVTIQGQRVISTTGIKCNGNNVTLQGVPYSPPYVIVGIGDPAAIVTALESDAQLDSYREAAADPRGAIGYDAVYLPEATAPGYEGLLDLTYAEAIDS